MLGDHKETFHSSVHSLRMCDRIRNERQKANLKFRHAWFRKQVSHTCPSLKIVRYYRQLSCISDATNDELNKLVFVGLLIIDFLVIYQEFRFYSESFRNIKRLLYLKVTNLLTRKCFQFSNCSQGNVIFYGLFVKINRISHLTQNHVPDYLKTSCFAKSSRSMIISLTSTHSHHCNFNGYLGGGHSKGMSPA